MTTTGTTRTDDTAPLGSTLASGARTAVPGGPPLDAGLRTAVARRLREDDDLLAGGGDRGALRRAVARALAAEGIVAAPDVWARLVRDLVDELGGLGPLEALLRDPAVTDVMVNGGDEVHIERDGRLALTGVRFDDDAHLTGVVRRVLGPLGVRLDRAHPYADAVLPGGVRLHAILPPLATRPTLTLRRVPAVVPTWEQLAAVGSVPADLHELLLEATAARRNIVVSGRAGVGKTTLLARLLAEVGSDRVVVIEDAPELRHPAPHTVHLQVRAATPDGVGQVDVATLLRNALRMRPDRLVVGEVRGHEVADLLQAMNTGHDGSMTTVHANGADEALVRLEGMALLAGVPLPAARAQVAAALDLVVALDRDRDGRRRVAHVVEVLLGRDGARTEVRWSR
ncbi:MAG: ATPase, T2SS/T4P/T4SS family [Nitriliruptor sp.]|uniref:CpaF family protein n=1 Tax=Nitriliruptor sp. TaxID=2448056 RepID=UPI00349FD353